MAEAYLNYSTLTRSWGIDIPLAQRVSAYVLPRGPQPPAQVVRDGALQRMGWRRVSPWVWREDQSGDVAILTATATVVTV